MITPHLSRDSSKNLAFSRIMLLREKLWEAHHLLLVKNQETMKGEKRVFPPIDG